MRVAYVINQYPTVTHSFIRREIHAIERQGIEVVRISLRGWEKDLVDDEDRLERERTKFVLREGIARLPLSVVLTLLTRPLRMVRALALAFRMSHRSERSLLFHLAYLAEACVILSWLRGKEIEHLHAHFSTNSAEVAMQVHVLGGPPWSFTVHGMSTLENPQFIGLSEKMRRCKFVVGIGEFARGQLYRFSDRRDWPKVKVVRCGLEPAFHAVPASPVPAARRLVCVGRLCPEKAQFLLLEAAQRLAANGEGFELVLAGDGDLREELEAEIAKHNLKKLVRITGWISSGQVRDELLAARALVLPSFAEGIPVVIMEAMALRRPVISTFVAGIPELVISGEHGWLVPSGDVDALVHAMRECLDAPADMLTRMGQAARARVLAHHDVDAEASKLAKLFLESGEEKKIKMRSSAKALSTK